MENQQENKEKVKSSYSPIFDFYSLLQERFVQEMETKKVKENLVCSHASFRYYVNLRRGCPHDLRHMMLWLRGGSGNWLHNDTFHRQLTTE